MKQPSLFTVFLNQNLLSRQYGFCLRGLQFILLYFVLSIAYAQPKVVNGPAGSAAFGAHITILTNGNYVVADPLFDNGGINDIGAVHLYNGNNHLLISTITGSSPGDQVGSGGVIALSGGNFVISSPNWKNGSYAKTGAATWGNGTTGITGIVSIANSLVGSTPDDNVSSSGITALPNGNYVVVSPHWEHNVLLMNDAGAVTWGNGNSGIAGTISESNSLVGSQWDDAVGGSGITILSNNNYIVSSNKWGGSTPLTSLGAVTWGNGAGGTAGRVSSSNSMVGSVDGDDVGSSSITALPNGNYVVNSPLSRQGGVTEAGAVTWGNGVSGTSGVVNSGNSLVGIHQDDLIDSHIVKLTNGNYLVNAANWDNGSTNNVGSVTWCNGLTGRVGQISASNSLIGSTADDYLGTSVPLTNGNYVVSSTFWNNGALVDAGIVIWCNGNTGSFGTVNPATAIVGTQSNGHVGTRIKALSNGHYVISSPDWDNGAITDAGAVTWVVGTGPTSGSINASNSIIGSSTYDFNNQKIVPLTNGNYVISSSEWDNGGIANVGAATWKNGSIPSIGTISLANSLIGSTPNDGVGLNIVPLPNGNYVVGSSFWDNGSIYNAGAITWGDGSAGISGELSVGNSLVGSSTSDIIGFMDLAPLSTIYALSNGNYLVDSYRWNHGSGAVTLGDGTRGTFGAVDASNSLVGNVSDNLGYSPSIRLNNGNYIANASYLNDGPLYHAGSATLGNGSVALSGAITRCNSIIGNVNSGYLSPNYNYTYNYLIVGLEKENSINIYKPDGRELTMTDSEANVSIIGNNQVPLLTEEGCKILGSITPNGSNPVVGKVHSQVWIEGSVPSTSSYPFVARHFQITPLDRSDYTARITLYFTHKNFLEFNDHPSSTLNLPASPGDISGKANLRIEKFAGKTTDGTGLPASYVDGSEIIDPLDDDIVWNDQYQRWEVTFNVITGFSGFIARTVSTALPVRLISFNGERQESSTILHWEIADADQFTQFEIERSADTKQFYLISKVGFTDQEKKYQYFDTEASSVASDQSLVYYRLKMLDLDGTYSYSRIVSIKFNDSDTKIVYPNPFSQEVSITTKNHDNENIEIQVIDSRGEILLSKKTVVINNKVQLTDLKIPNGKYIIRLKTTGNTSNFKAIKFE